MHGSDCGCADRANGHNPDSIDYRASVDNSAWDGPAAMSGCSNSGTPASCFGSICAGKKAGDTATQDAWALPHHKHPGDPPNAAGVQNSLSRLPQTQGLTNAAAAKAHLQAHMKAINPDYAGDAAEPPQAGPPARADARARARAGVRESRRDIMPKVAAARAAWANDGQHHARREAPNPGGRTQGFGSKLRAVAAMKDGGQFYELEGTASVVDQPYEMYDMFGPYDEVITKGSFDASLATDGLDVAFLLNHKGVTMARTTNGTLSLWASPDLAVRAYVNAGRADVRDMVSAIADELITEMSFAFWLRGGEWSDDYMTFTIDEADINRGDVSAVNYGANPYTSIAARTAELLDAVDRMPAGLAREMTERLAARPDLTDPRIGWEPPQARGDTPEQLRDALHRHVIGYRVGGKVHAPTDVDLVTDWADAGVPDDVFPVPGGEAKTGLSVQMLALQLESDDDLDH
jgi:hypothetical protein